MSGVENLSSYLTWRMFDAMQAPAAAWAERLVSMHGDDAGIVAKAAARLHETRVFSAGRALELADGLATRLGAGDAARGVVELVQDLRWQTGRPVESLLSVAEPLVAHLGTEGAHAAASAGFRVSRHTSTELDVALAWGERWVARDGADAARLRADALGRIEGEASLTDARMLQRVDTAGDDLLASLVERKRTARPLVTGHARAELPDQVARFTGHDERRSRKWARTLVSNYGGDGPSVLEAAARFHRADGAFDTQNALRYTHERIQQGRPVEFSAGTRSTGPR